MSRAPAVFASDEHVDPDGHLDRARHHGMSGKIWKQKQTHPCRMAIEKNPTKIAIKHFLLGGYCDWT
jgi:hypothetical protein